VLDVLAWFFVVLIEFLREIELMLCRKTNKLKRKLRSHPLIHERSKLIKQDNLSTLNMLTPEATKLMAKAHNKPLMILSKNQVLMN